MILPIQVILSTRQDGIAGLGVPVWPPDRKDLFFSKKARFFSRSCGISLSGVQTGMTIIQGSIGNVFLFVLAQSV
jgi:hypothetical protein